ncbi:hypothetical protein [Thiofilum flexile]|uniref:hypothetical protein n=1 Tax=Thiofilum flexile TaxID=125627 RepID=UPI0003703F05|nr:hypothetical protein [Thiofilum flexile]
MDKVRDSWQWLLKHPIAFAWILAFIAIALNLFVGAKTPEAKNVAPVEAAATNPQPSAQAAHGGQAMAEQATQAAQAAPTDTAATETAAAQSNQATPAAPTQAVAEVKEVVTETENQSAAADTNIEPVDTVTTTVATTTIVMAETSDVQSLLKTARQAYWDGVKSNNMAKLEEAVSWYEKLTALDANPAYKGELANVFWKMENPEKATDLYIEIGPWLKEQGRTIELINMKVYVDITNPEKGKKLGALIGQ